MTQHAPQEADTMTLPDRERFECFVGNSFYVPGVDSHAHYFAATELATQLGFDEDFAPAYDGLHIKTGPNSDLPYAPGVTELEPDDVLRGLTQTILKSSTTSTDQKINLINKVIEVASTRRGTWGEVGSLLGHRALSHNTARAIVMREASATVNPIYVNGIPRNTLFSQLSEQMRPKISKRVSRLTQVVANAMDSVDRK